MKKFDDVRYGIIAGCVISLCFLAGALLTKNYENAIKERQLRCPVTPAAQRAVCLQNAQDGIAPAPGKVFQNDCAPAVHKDDATMTNELINGFYSPATPGSGSGE